LARVRSGKASAALRLLELGEQPIALTEDGLEGHQLRGGLSEDGSQGVQAGHGFRQRRSFFVREHFFECVGHRLNRGGTQPISESGPRGTYHSQQGSHILHAEVR
jgi:hypothetical protein